MTGKLRIIAGAFGGRLIACPDAVARPTTDRVREALFSSLVSFTGGLDGLSVCDAFAGSGALGFEALSRGASKAQFFDADAGALTCLNRNASVLGVGASARVMRRDVLTQGLDGAQAPYDIVFLDPPYAFDAARIASLLTCAADDGLLALGCLITYERAAASPSLSAMSGFDLVKQKRYGKTAIDLLRYEP